ncbi:hypothetical protein Taro_053981 [Colocasia esculenta]|uniref:Uncharacterized protein n=1 Tax=Colocasia esculenta TaxID=4460 RepID=A0A843XP80_COLES|nr:hypothetical protein [Colocasia esculenta]
MPRTQSKLAKRRTKLTIRTHGTTHDANTSTRSHPRYNTMHPGSKRNKTNHLSTSTWCHHKHQNQARCNTVAPQAETTWTRSNERKHTQGAVPNYTNGLKRLMAN